MDRDKSQDDLTRPALSAIFDSSLNDNDNDTSIYNDLPTNIAKHPEPDQISPPVPRVHITTRILRFFTSLVVLGVLGIVFNQVGQHIHDNHILVPDLASKPLRLGFHLTHNFVSSIVDVDVPRPAVYAIEGIFLGSIVPLVDRFVFRTSPSSSKITSTDKSSVVRAAVAFLGVSFAVRRVEWTSSLQAASAWSMLNPCLWFLLDGTASGFITSLVMAAISSISVVYTDMGVPTGWIHNGEWIATVLWLANFIFFGLIVFGKIGRYLFA